MSMINGRVFSLMALFLLTFESKDALAFISVDVTTELFESSVFGTCTFQLSDLEPYAAMNTDCQMTRDSIQVSLKQLPGVQFGWPRPSNSIWTKPWFVTTLNPKTNSEYCTNFYDVDNQFGTDVFLLAHHTNSNLNVLGERFTTCETAEPTVRVYYQTFCIGGFDDTFSFGGVIGTVLSYRFLDNLNVCWAMAVEGSQ